MAGGDVPKAITGAGAIGRYFTVVSLVPSTVFVAYVVLLVESGAWSDGEVRLAAAIGGLDLKDAAVTGLASILLALAIHPLGFALIQLYEGYWGTSRPATFAAVLLTMRHHARATRLLDLRMQATQHRQSSESGNASAIAVRDALSAAEGMRLHDYYPHEPNDVMPTRLGNVLRRYERLAGTIYGIEAMMSVPRLLQVAPARDVEYVQNQRVQLELALRTSFLGLVASIVTMVFMWRHGGWLALTLAPYAVSYAAYRGAVEVAHGYGTALAVLIDLNRFALYERLRAPLPDNIEQERALNADLVNAMSLTNVQVEKRLKERPPLDYVHPPLDAPILNVSASAGKSWKVESLGKGTALSSRSESPEP